MLVRPDDTFLKGKLDLAGILDGRRAFCGPTQVVIDLTNFCNMNCIACWTRSPLLGSHAPPSQWLRTHIPGEVMHRTLEELARVGTKMIRYTGGGEPFLYPHVMRVLEQTKKLEMGCDVTTNLVAMSHNMLRRCVELGVDGICASIWAASPEAYARVHPDRTATIFHLVEDLLLYLASIKNRVPFLTIANVICKLNYTEVVDMFEFAVRMKADRVYFTLVDPIPGATHVLLLDESERREVLKQCEEIERRHVLLPPEKRPVLDFFDGFKQRLAAETACEGSYDARLVNEIPCYVGWFFCRITAEGNVCPCCRAVKMPMGNINKESFESIWFSARYDEFRYNAKHLPKTYPYFAPIECHKTCDNLLHNRQMHTRVTALSPQEREMIMKRIGIGG
jgi:MoaA/NifB/PqqE/SkfB family radical SAM enzyme